MIDEDNSLTESINCLGVEQKKEFVTHYKLPILLLDSPDFEYFIDLYDPLFKTKHKLKCFLEAYKEKGSNLSEYTKQIRKNIIDTIKATQAYQQFSSSETEKKFKISSNKNSNKPYWKTSSIYEVENQDKYFISIDIKQANFTALKTFSKELTIGCNSWEELVQKFSHLEYIADSKQFRQSTVSLINNNKQSIIVKYLTNVLLQRVLSTSLTIHTVQFDEIIVQSTRNSLVNDLLVLRTVLREHEDMTHITGFRLVCLHKERKFFVKETFPTDSLKEKVALFKCISHPFLAQSVKHYYKQHITEVDKKFIYEGVVVNLKRAFMDSSCERVCVSVSM